MTIERNTYTFRNDATSGGPTVRFGTKCPSITSTCKAVPRPQSPHAHRCQVAQVTARIDGNSSIFVMNGSALLPPEA